MKTLGRQPVTRIIFVDGKEHRRFIESRTVYEKSAEQFLVNDRNGRTTITMEKGEFVWREYIRSMRKFSVSDLLDKSTR